MRASSICCCCSVLQSEISLINSSDNVETSSMTSIRGAGAHCAAFQPPLSSVNSSSLGRKDSLMTLQPPASSVRSALRSCPVRGLGRGGHQLTNKLVPHWPG